MTTRVMTGAAIAVALVLLSANPTSAAEIVAFISTAFKTAMEELAPQFEKASGHTLKTTIGPTEPFKERIEKGEAFDFTIIAEPAIDDLIKQGKLVASTRTMLAHSGLGLAIRPGAPKPNLSTPEAFKRALLNTKSVVYSEQGRTGIYLKELFTRLAMTDDMKSRFKGGSGSALVAKGEAEIGIMQASEVLITKGVEFGGKLPSEIQLFTKFSAAISTTTKQPEAAQAFLDFLSPASALPVFLAHHLDAPAYPCCLPR